MFLNFSTTNLKKQNCSITHSLIITNYLQTAINHLQFIIYSYHLPFVITINNLQLINYHLPFVNYNYDFEDLSYILLFLTTDIDMRLQIARQVKPFPRTVVFMVFIIHMTFLRYLHKPWFLFINFLYHVAKNSIRLPLACFFFLFIVLDIFNMFV